jgi:hypothetical protein
MALNELRRGVRALALAGALALGVLPAPASARGALRGEFDHAAIARGYREELGHGAGDAQPSLEGLFAQHFVQGRLGLFEVLYPVAELGDHAGEFK